MNFDIEVLEDFERITSIDISGYLRDSITFFSSDYNFIVAYYSGNVSQIDSGPFKRFDELRRRNNDVLISFKNHAYQFNNLKWWLLIEQVEEIDSRLKTLSKINKWTRSTLDKVGYDPKMKVDYVIKQNQPLENISSGLLGSSNPNDDWVDIAVSNRLTEEDYTNEGGNEIQLSIRRNNTAFKINSVVDVIRGKSVYGKDVYRKIQWDSEANDIKALGYEETILQAANILSNLKKNDNPNNPNNGVQASLVSGTNRNSLNFPIVVRQVLAVFANDDTFKNFTVDSLNIDQDNFYYNFRVQTRLNEVIQDGQFQ